MSWETIAVLVIVGVALLGAARWTWRSVKSRQICSSCAQSGGCPAVNADTPPPADCGAVPVDLEVKQRDRSAV